MNILVIGGTRFFGIHTVNALLEKGHKVTLATRGNTNNIFCDRVEYITIERTNAESDFTGEINGSSSGTISLREMIEYVENKCDVKAIVSQDGDKAPYNNEVEYSINTDLAGSIGYKFSNLNDWIYDLIDYYIDSIRQR